ncbi:N-acetylmuramoyl-L-alanine amidase [Planococcus antarcticus DSM 14505]|uniref:N-acetylmuramoyl-L-alanine amidase n=1 Tax=Planococcus antarcticus DSM 14505 TaxID=1185653 RepID=A0A1C7DF24_9BACL|nr:N-acetylmuramoyl-L-alanine amidase [Planococcus antarcticus]ANU10086.1 N-acetylmuramoyl-L-alanine amidase [Planococcus antarcticus DSM 14505]EIM07327.1 N-acetylmuramoyl-L-alanine amidase [Planococcus antarcticus DSM 14505]
MKNVLSKITLFLVAAVFVISSLGVQPVSAASNPFKDVSSSDEEILYLWNKGLINGVSKTAYGSEQAVTREQAATLIGRARNVNGTPRKTKFADVDPSRYSSGYIQSAVEKGYITGNSDGTFRPYDTMTRGEMAFLLSRAFNYTHTGDVFFSDLKADSHPASLYTAVNKIATAGVSNGTGTGTYSPNNKLIREEFAIFLARALSSTFKVSYKNVTIDNLNVTVNSLNVRTGPSTGYRAIGKLNTGAAFQVFGYNGSWAYGKSGNTTGYVSSTFLGKAAPATANNRFITLDPGHGAQDPGAVANGLREKDINLDVSKRVEAKLKAKGIKVYMTRTTDVFHSLDARVDKGVASGSNAFLSIHTNAASAAASGSETFYSASVGNDSKQLATFIQNRLYKAMDHPNRGVKNYGFQVIRTNPLPAALVELGFVTNKYDAAKLASGTYKDRAATAIAEGIEDYYNWKAKN